MKSVIANFDLTRFTFTLIPIAIGAIGLFNAIHYPSGLTLKLMAPSKNSDGLHIQWIRCA
jgi:hypothetical protein